MSTKARFCPSCGEPRTHVREQLEEQADRTGEPYQEMLDQARARGLEVVAPDPLLGVSEYPFGIRSLKEQRFYHRLFNRQPSENALIEINNLLASGIRTVTAADIEEIAETYELDPFDEFREQFQEMYRDYLAYCYADETLAEDERRDLDHLQRLLKLDAGAVEQIHTDVALAVFERAVDRALADRRFTLEERTSIESLQERLGLPDDAATDVFGSRAQTVLQRYVDNAVADERLSPDEDRQLASFADSLGIDVKYDDETAAALDRFRQYWRIEHGELEPVPPGINLYKSEECYAIRDVQWYEYRRKTRSLGFSGPTARIRIAKGIYWRAGKLGIDRQSEDVLEQVDQGQLFLTSKRLLFMGQKRNTTIRLNRVLDYRPYANGIEIRKDSGKNPFFAFEDDIDLFALTLERMVQDYG